MASDALKEWIPKTLPGRIVAGAGAVVAGAATAGYVVANSSIFHRGPSGLGSCTTASGVLNSFDASAFKGATVMVTGPNSGIGLETARAFALAGATVVLPCRSMAKAEGAQADIAATCRRQGVAAACVPMVLDLNDLDSVREFAAQFQAKGLSLKALVCNAGIMAVPERRATAQGFESQIGICHLAHFLLARLLLPQLQAAKPSRVVFVSSTGHRLADTTAFADSDTLEDPAGYHPWKAYGYAKMSNILCAREWQARYGDSEGVTGYSVHPGGIFTNLQGHVPLKTMLFWKLVAPFFFKSTQQGASTSVYCAAHPTALAKAGQYFEDCNLSQCTGDKAQWLEDAALRKKLWERSEQMVGL